MDVVGVVVGLLNLLILGWITWLGYRVQHQLTQIEESRRKDEVDQRKQAEVTARIDHGHRTTGAASDYFLVVRNQGPAAAHQVNVELSAPLGQPPTLVDTSGLPIPLLDPAGEVRLMLGVVIGTDSFLDVTLSWEDGNGPDKKILRLTLF